MQIERTILQHLIAWKDKPGRKPLMLHGARQTGKTWLLKYSGNNYFKSVKKETDYLLSSKAR
jgi:predicted AAA+ superfamily ATPase